MDKTHFIPEWLASDARITLITRPRRFGKSMLLSTVRTFFDPMYADHPEYFKKLQVWKDKDCRRLFGTIPVISVSFGSCKGNHFEQAMRGVTLGLYNMYVQHEYLREKKLAFSIDLIVAISFIIGENKADRRSLG